MKKYILHARFRLTHNLICAKDSAGMEDSYEKKCAHYRQSRKQKKIMLLILEFVIILLLAIALLSNQIIKN